MITAPDVDEKTVAAVLPQVPKPDLRPTPAGHPWVGPYVDNAQQAVRRCVVLNEELKEQKIEFTVTSF